MKIEKFKHTGVKPDGTFKDKAGAVETDGVITMSREEGGCGLKGCKCSPGYWISITLARKGSIVEGIKVNFENKDEMDRFLKHGQLMGVPKKK